MRVAWMTDSNGKVGYKRPPKHSQFKKGQSGNPGGRRRLKSGTLRDALSEVLEAKWRNGLTFREEVALELVKKAIIGNAACMTLLLREFE